MSKPLYSCSQANLYTACRLIVKSCLAILAELMGFKAKYIQAFFDQLSDNIDAAEMLPDLPARQSLYKRLDLDLKAARDKIVVKFGLLQSYIDDSFDADKVKIMYEEAGSGRIAKVKKDNWTEMTQLMSSVLLFFDTHKVVLMAKNNMPAQFETDFRALIAETKSINDACDAAYTAASEKKDEKIDANNDIFTTVSGVLLDIQRMYQDNPAKAKQYTFAAFESQTHGVKNAGLAGKVVRDVNKFAQKDVRITIKDFDIVVMTDEKGRFEISPLSSGKYTIIVEKEGFVTQIFKDFKISTGVTSRLNVELVAVVEV